MSYALQYVTLLLSLSILFESCGNPNLQRAEHEQVKSSTKLCGLHGETPSAASGLLPNSSSAVTSFSAPASPVVVSALRDYVPTCGVPSSCESVLFEEASPELLTQELRHTVLSDADEALAQRIPLLVSSRTYLPRVPFSTVAQLPSSSSETFFSTSHCYGPFRVSSGKEIIFRQQADGVWHAVVKDAWSDHEELLPVVCRGDVTAILLDLQEARAIDVLHRIHMRECHHASRYVYVGALGVRGGMEKKKKKHKRQTKRLSAANEPSGTTAASTVATDDACYKHSTAFHYESLLKSVSAYQAYLEDHFEDQEFLIKKYLKDNNIEDEGWALQAVEAAYERYNNLINDIYELAAKLMHSKIDVSDCLVKLLETRKEYLLVRETNVQNWLAAERVQKVTYIVPSSELFFDAFTKKNREEGKKLNDYSREVSVRYFELMNSLICDLVPLYTFSPDDEKLARLLCDSVQLHPILKGKVNDLGHPDQCTSFQKIERILEKFAPEWSKFVKTNNESVSRSMNDDGTEIIYRRAPDLVPAKKILSEIFSLRAIKNQNNYRTDATRNVQAEFGRLASACFCEDNSGITLEPNFFALIKTIYTHTNYFKDEVAEMWQECECDVHNKVHDNQEPASEKIARLGVLRTTEDSTTSEIPDEQLDSDAATEASQVASEHESLEHASRGEEMEELDPHLEDQKLPAALNETAGTRFSLHENQELTTEELKVIEELKDRSRLSYAKCVTLLSKLGGKVTPGKGSHCSIRNADQIIGCIVTPHGRNVDSWPGPKVHKAIMCVAEELIQRRKA